MYRRVVSALLPLLFILAACATAGGDMGKRPPTADGPAGVEERDLAALRPESVRGPTRLELHEHAAEAYAAGDWEEAARRYARIVERDPEDAIAWYNLACAFALLGSGEQAAAFLGAAWEAGFTNLDQVRADPDFAGVRETPAFEAKVAELESLAAKASSGERLTYPATVVGEVHVVAPADLEPGERRPLVVALHGWGGNALQFAPMLAPGPEDGFFWAFPEASYPAPLPDGRSWFLPDPAAPRRPALGSRAQAEANLLAALDSVLERYPVDPAQVYVVGFSQGAFMAWSLALRHPDRFRGAAPIGGWVVPEEHEGAALSRAVERLSLLVCHSPEDTSIPWTEAEAGLDWMKRVGIRSEVFRYPGGHVVPPEVAARIRTWISNGGR